jgi:hypothetical protein
MRRGGPMAGAVEIQFGEVTGRIVLLLLIIVPFLVVAWSVRNAMVEKEIRRLQRVAGLPDPGPDRAPLAEWMRVRQTGRVIGLTAMFLAGGALCAYRGDIPFPWIAIVVPVAAALGTGLGHLRSIPAGTRPRVAQLRRRELRDYVTPGERAIARATLPLPVAAVAVLIAGAVMGSPSGTAVALAAGGLAATVAVSATTVWILRRALARAVDLGSPLGLAWEEVVRAQTLRDLLGCAALLAAGGGAAVLVTAEEVSVGWPHWFRDAARVLLGVALLVLLALLVAAIADQHFGWARGHALADVHP